MADIKSPEERSKNMAKIRSKDTTPEVYIRKLLFSKGYRYRKNVNYIPGHPDLYLAKYNTAIFVHGCYWHRHEGCKYAYMPKSRVDFWINKFSRNIERDSIVRKQLEKREVRCLIIWECAIRKMKDSNTDELSYLNKLIGMLNGKEKYLEIG